MNDITIFNHLGNDIRVMTDEQGEPLFVLKDICDALDLKNISDVASRLDEDGVGTTEVIDNLGRTQKTNVVTEAGLYEVIFMSRKPEAKAFKRWVTSEVLPSIRKHGMYATPATIEDMIANPDIMWLREAAHRTRVVAMYVAEELRNRLAYVKGFGWMAYTPRKGSGSLSMRVAQSTASTWSQKLGSRPQ